jgi:hypothetical protein
MLALLSTDGIDNMIQIILFIFGLIGWLIVAKLNKESSKKDKRLFVYNDVLEKFESINNKFSITYSSSLSKSMLDFQVAIIQDPNNVNQYLINFMQENQKYLKESMDLASSLFSQFSRFRLVASKNTIDLFEKYKKESLIYINQVYSSMQSINLNEIGSLQNQYQNIEKQSQEKGIELKELYEELENQMKKDIGF